ncbi:MAG: diguanylate cyclase [Aquisalinus sp.]|nr:diguanylate cyclase [Aquisalinus sp.]
MKQNLLLFTVCYVVALTLIALASVGIHWAERETIARQEQNAELINVAGRQRMLSQRIVSLDLRLRNTEPQAVEYAPLKSSLQEAVALMSASHERLAEDDLILPEKAPLFNDIERLYFGDSRLDHRVRKFLADASQPRVGSSLLSPSQSLLLAEQADTLLPDLNQAVSLYEENARAEIQRIESFTQAGVLFILGLLLAEALLIFRPLGKRLHGAETHLQAIASTDPLTGCHNRRGLMSAARSSLAYFSRHRREVAAIIFDIDHFKKVNDTYGHGTGDEVIKFVVDRALASIRASDIMGRIGGEEFVIFCPDTSDEQAGVVAEKVRKVIESTPYRDGPLDIRVTCSFGVFAQQPDKNTCPAWFIERADEALYAAKRAGRNRVRFTGLPSECPSQLPENAAA